MSRKKRKKTVDKVAATFILQAYLDRNRKGWNYG
jgi:RNase H-fold protein (predicted Holliday junction resolvase)